MSGIYIEYKFKVKPLNPGREILIAELGYAGFESFVETEDGVTAYIQKGEWKTDILGDVDLLNNDLFEISHEFSEIEQINWNAEWEKSFQPIVVENRCSVRAPFHEKPDTEFDIVIEPKMSFGTGHHETTHMMLEHMLDTDLEGKKVLDMGCGTGVLAIFAEMKGAIGVDAIDIDNWCYLNSLENVERNSCRHIKVYEGDAGLLKGKEYDVVIANINRNILLNDLPVYIDCLNKGGILLLSGFYEDDIPLIDEACKKYGLEFAEKKEKNFWVAVKYVN